MLQIVNLSIADRNIELNRVFAADGNWLRDLKIRVRNVSRQRLSCIGISFGLLAEIETKLGPRESWPWGLGFYKGACGDGKLTVDERNFSLKPGMETVLEFRDIPKRSMNQMGSFGKAVLHPKARIKIDGKAPREQNLALPPNTLFLEDELY